MANTLDVNYEVDGKHLFQATASYTWVDTTDPETVILDSSAMTGGLPIKEIDCIEVTAIGCSAVVSFKQTTLSDIVICPADDTVKKYFKAPRVNPEGTGSTGDVVLNTTGLSASGDKVLVTVKGRKS